MDSLGGTNDATYKQQPHEPWAAPKGTLHFELGSVKSIAQLTKIHKLSHAIGFRQRYSRESKRIYSTLSCGMARLHDYHEVTMTVWSPT